MKCQRRGDATSRSPRRTLNGTRACVVGGSVGVPADGFSQADCDRRASDRAFYACLGGRSYDMQVPGVPPAVRQCLGACRAPQYMTEELLRSEGFTDVRYVPWRGSAEATEALAAGRVDITMQYIGLRAPRSAKP